MYQDYFFKIESYFFLGVESISNQPLFSISVFQQYIVPRLLHMFSVRDAQVRLLLLEHFDHYCTAFSKEQLCSKVLPEVSHFLVRSLSLPCHTQVLAHVRSYFLALGGY